MTKQQILDRIQRGRADLVFDLLALPDWCATLKDVAHKPLQWFVYYDDVTALKAVLAAGGDLKSIDLDQELGNAAFFGHWRTCDFLLRHGANVNAAQPRTGETPLHSALCKAGRPYFAHVVRLLLAHGANANARTTPGVETGAFMRDIRTKGETPLHRAAAYGDETTIKLLLDHGADREVRDAAGDSPLTWASAHLRPGSVLSLLQFGPHRIGAGHVAANTSDHGCGWGNGMERNFVGDFLPESLPDEA
ncbi:MAG: ankyrin repeat domain-containing protein [Alphaproteobacteria bacterium]|nr:ankyrin repeat domain-containing protein [Alphaproteobacteria bacterium]